MASILIDSVAETYDPWPLRRERAAELSARHAYASALLDFYGRLAEVQGRAFWAAHRAQPASDQAAAYAVRAVLPEIVNVTVAAGPGLLRDTVVERHGTANLERIVRAWLAGEPLTPVDTFLARASTQPVLEACSNPLPHPPPPAGEGNEAPQGAASRVCPRCGGLPQLSYFSHSGEALVSGPRYLVCSRCSHAWVFSRMTCAFCGEAEPHRLPIFKESEHLPHVRVDGCQTCRHYLLTLDLRREPRAVPVVDELAAIPLDLYARDRGLTKITPNLLGN